MASSTSSELPPKKRKRLRAPLSCDQCRMKKRKCDRQCPCSRCLADSEPCTNERARRVRSIAEKRRREQSDELQLQQEEEKDYSFASRGIIDEIDDSHFQAEPTNVTSISTTSTTYRSSRPYAGPGSITWPSPRSSEPSEQSTAPSTIFSPQDCSSQALLSPRKKSVFSLAQLAEKESIFSLTLHATFFTQVMEIYIREIDWILDLLRDTRLHRLIVEYPSVGLQACSSDLSEAFHILAIAVVAITAQMCPTELQAVVLTTDWLVPLRELTKSSEMAVRAYHVAISRLNDPTATGEPKDWPAEHFAASLLLRVYEKNDGRARSTKENLLVDLYRLQQAGLHRQPFQRTHEVENSLAYRVFWQYFDKDCVLSWFGKVGRVINTQRAEMCLRDPFGHRQIDHLCGLINQPTISCSCQRQGLQGTSLSAFVGGAVRLSAITSRFSDRAGSISSPSFRWPNDAEQLAQDFNSELAMMENDVEMRSRQSPEAFRHAQKELLILSIAHFRSELAKMLCEAFADNLILIGTPKGTTDALLQRRRLDAAMGLLVKAKSVTAKLARSSISWIFCPMFVHEHTVVLLDSLLPYLEPARATSRAGSATNPVQPLNQLDEPSRRYLLKVLRHVVLGRNLMVLLTRRNELCHAKTLVHDVCNKVHSMIAIQLLSGQCSEPINDVFAVVDEQAVMTLLNRRIGRSLSDRSMSLTNTTKVTETAVVDRDQPRNDVFSHSFQPVFEDAFVSPQFFMDEDFSAFFKDLPSLSQLFEF